ncbi:hypothetical protein MNBD_GAMMA02-1619, partial [hydrothermal vent metagenome]
MRLFNCILFILFSTSVYASEQWANAASPDPLNYSGFGDAIAVLDNWMVIGDPENDDMATDGGAVHVYDNSQGQWQLFDTLYAENADNFDAFGSAVAIERLHNTGEIWIMASALGDDDAPGNDIGAVYGFQMVDGLSFTYDGVKLFGDSLSRNFGTSLALNYDYVEDIGTFLWVLVVGDEFAHQYIDPDFPNNGTRSTGGVTIFKRSGGLPWERELVQGLPPLGDSFARLGTSVATDGIFIVAGAPFLDNNALGNDGVDQGGVYVYARSGITQTWNCCSIVRANTTRGARFGFSVDVAKQFNENVYIYAGA